MEDAGAGRREVRVRALGALHVDGADVRALPSRKARTMLRVLALAGGRPVSVDRLVDCLWDDDSPAHPEREVAVAASRLRRVLGSDRVARTDGGYELRVDWIDAVSFAELAAEARRRLEAGDVTGSRATADAALRLADEPLLGGEPDAAWVAAERSHLEQALTQLRLTAAEAALAAGAHGDAIVHASDLLEADPYDESALRIVMRAHRAAGRPGSALAAYAEMRRRLADDLGANPSAETEQLHTDTLIEDASGTPAGAGEQRAAAAARSVELVGRARELHELDTELRSATDESRVVVLVGEPGVGKTRLVTEWSRHVGDEGFTVLAGRCDAVSDLPFQPVVDALVDRLRQLAPAERDSVLGSDRVILSPWLGIDVTDETSLPATHAAPDAARTLVSSALLRVIGRIGGGRAPVVLVLDDVHLADDATTSWLAFAHRHRGAMLSTPDEIAPPVVLVVATARSGERAELPGRRVDVDPLDRDAVATLAGDRADELWESTRGNALLLVELLATGETGAPVVTPTVRDAVEARCERLGPAASTLRAAAVLAREVDLDLLAGVLRVQPLDALADLEAAVERSFLEERKGRLAFRHELVREALIEGTTATRRRLLHREAVALLRMRADRDPLLLAHHAREAGDLAAVSGALVEAARLAALRSDLAAAEALATEAVAAEASATALLARGRIRLSRSDLDGADADAEAALERGGGAGAWEQRAWVARYRHDMAAAIRWASLGAESATDPATRARCLLVSAFAHRGEGDLREAEAALTAAREADVDHRVPLASWTGVLRVHQGRPDEGLAMLEPAVAAPPDLVQGFWREHVLQMTVHGLGLQGRVADALALLDRLVDEMQRRGTVRRYRGVDGAYRCWLLTHLGDPGADDLALQAAEAPGMGEIVAQATLDRAAVALRDDQLDRAERLLADVTDRISGEWFHNRWRCEQRVAYLGARLALMGGDAARAEELAATLEAEASERGERRYTTLGRLARAQAQARQGATIDPSAVVGDLAKLDEVAALESWWITAELARDLGVDSWWRTAAERVERLARASGGHGDILRTHAARRYERLAG